MNARSSTRVPRKTPRCRYFGGHAPVSSPASAGSASVLPKSHRRSESNSQYTVIGCPSSKTWHQFVSPVGQWRLSISRPQFLQVDQSLAVALMSPPAPVRDAELGDSFPVILTTQRHMQDQGQLIQPV